MPYEGEEPPWVEPDPELDALAHAVIGAAIEVHRRLGPGLDEGLYEGALCVEFRQRGVDFARQVIVPVLYKGEVIGEKRIDLVVGRRLIVELKSVETLTPAPQSPAPHLPEDYASQTWPTDQLQLHHPEGRHQACRQPHLTSPTR